MDIPLLLAPGLGQPRARIVQGIQALASSGRIPPGTRIPPAKILAAQIHVNHLTVLKAYRELAAMGYLEVEVGHGTFVARQIPETFLKAAPQAGKPPDVRVLKTLLKAIPARSTGSSVSQKFASDIRPHHRISFHPLMVDKRLFPSTVWRRLQLRHLLKEAHLVQEPLSPTQGVPALIEAIRARVLPSRGMQVGTDSILIVPNMVQGLHLCLDLLLKQGDRVLVEEPCMVMMRSVVSLRGGRPVPVPVDGRGLVPAALKAAAGRSPRAILLTPSRQFPTGAILDPERARLLLRMASERPFWILEHDYDHEFHFDSPPQASLASLSPGGNVIYFGSFTKTIGVNLRLSYVVAAPPVISRLADLVLRTGGSSMPVLPQITLADFIQEGHYDLHLRRLRRLYQRRRDAAARLLQEHAPAFSFQVPEGGTRFWIKAPAGLDVERLADRLSKAGIFVRTGGIYFQREPCRGYLNFGFTTSTEAELEEGIRALRREAGALRRR